MTLTTDHINEPTVTENVRIERVLNAIESINGTEISFLILEASNGDFLQCAGNHDNLVVEFRAYTNNQFKHFVIGPEKKLTSPLKIIWHAVDCKVGPIMVHHTETFNKNAVKELFKAFYEHQQLPTHLNFRNITKNFVRN